ncbi:MAG: TPM domain-containing protein [Flavobacteriales bacterium]
MNVRDFLNQTEELQVLEAIKKAETNTSGEIRVHLETECKKEVLERAKEVFEKLKMHKTKLRNGVLFYVATESKHFAILGDKGINEKVEPDFWNSTKEIVLQKMREGERAKALELGIHQAGERLKTHFPYQQDDLNELSDEISTGI